MREVEQTLAEHKQMLAFEPPYFGDRATLGGSIACGLSGPRRPYNGAARDFVLGCKIINGKGEVLHFGGEVMKNVAGYDVSRVMTGALGTLGLLLEISLKVLPRPEIDTTLAHECSEQQALQRMNAWAAKPLPVSGTCYVDGRLYVRLSGTALAVEASVEIIGGDYINDGGIFWRGLREQSLPFFSDVKTLWRIAVPVMSPLDLSGGRLIEWGGAQYWLASEVDARSIQEKAAKVGGHATLFRGGQRRGDVFQPLTKGLRRLHENMKQAFDPHGIFNPGRMYSGL